MTSMPASTNRPSHGMSRKGLFQDDLILTSSVSSERRKATLHITVERAFQPATPAFGPACLSARLKDNARLTAGMAGWKLAPRHDDVHPFGHDRFRRPHWIKMGSDPHADTGIGRGDYRYSALEWRAGWRSEPVSDRKSTRLNSSHSSI